MAREESRTRTYRSYTTEFLPPVIGLGILIAIAVLGYHFLGVLLGVLGMVFYVHRIGRRD